MTDGSGVRDMLATAIVHFDSSARTADRAVENARSMLLGEVEDSGLLGEGHLGTVRMSESGPDDGEDVYDASAVTLFRILVEPGDDPKAIAQARLDAEIEQSGILSCGTVVTVLDDQGK